MVSGPELARLVNDFQADVNKEVVENKTHHEQTDSVQRAFTKQVDKLCQVFEDHGNPFTESNNDLIVLDTPDIVDESVVDTIKTHDIGKNNLIHL